MRLTRSSFLASVSDFDWLMGVNTRGVMLCFKYAAQQMINQGGGGKIIGSLNIVAPSQLNRIADVGVLYAHVQVLAQWQGSEVRCSCACNYRSELRRPSKGLPNICAYSMSKFAVRGLVQSLGGSYSTPLF